jgi:hypothetical protein
MLPAGMPALRGRREAGVVFVAVAHQRVELRLHFVRLALGSAKALRGGVHVVLGEANKRLDRKVFRHRQPPWANSASSLLQTRVKFRAFAETLLQKRFDARIQRDRAVE